MNFFVNDSDLNTTRIDAMSALNKLVTVTFDEHPSQPRDTRNELAIVIQGRFSDEKYAQAIFQKILQIGLSEVPKFLQYHCDRVKMPATWLNNLEKLIKENIDQFNNARLKHRHTKLISQIDIKRHSLEEANLYGRARSHVNGYNEFTEFCFIEVKNHIQTFDTLEEKIIYLKDEIYDYRQSPPLFVKTSLPAFDQLCEIEIERLKKQEALKEKLNKKKASTSNATTRLPFNGELKVLCDVYFKMMNTKTKDGYPMLPWTITQATEHICNSYCLPDGTSLSQATVRTYLSPSKAESRPKKHKEINIDDTYRADREP